VLYLCGYRDEQRQRLSDATCTALQLANFWQDVSRDLDRRIYIPLDAAAAQGLSESNIVERRFDDRYVRLMKDLIARTRLLFAEGQPLANMVEDVSAWTWRCSLGAALPCSMLSRRWATTPQPRPAVSKLKQAVFWASLSWRILAGGNARSNEIAPPLAVVGRGLPRSTIN